MYFNRHSGQPIHGPLGLLCRVSVWEIHEKNPGINSGMDTARLMQRSHSVLMG